MSELSTAVTGKKSALVGAMARPESPRGLPGVMDRMVRFLRSSPIGTISLFIWIALIFVAILAPYLAPYDPIEADFAAVRSGPSAAHLLGTDVWAAMC